MSDGLDDETLALMTKAVKEAHQAALEIGHVSIADVDEFLDRYVMVVDKFGNKVKIKQIEPNVKYPIGTKFEIPESLK